MTEPLSRADRAALMGAPHSHWNNAVITGVLEDCEATVQRAEAALREIADLPYHAAEMKRKARAYFEEAGS